MARRIIRLEHGVTLSTGVRQLADPEYRALAYAVLLQAFRDATAGDARARHFLLGGCAMAFWCGLAGIEISAATASASKALARGRDQRRVA